MRSIGNQSLTDDAVNTRIIQVRFTIRFHHVVVCGIIVSVVFFTSTQQDVLWMKPDQFETMIGYNVFLRIIRFWYSGKPVQFTLMTMSLFFSPPEKPARASTSCLRAIAVLGAAAPILWRQYPRALNTMVEIEFNPTVRYPAAHVAFPYSLQYEHSVELAIIRVTLVHTPITGTRFP